jgi:hypothetical protein
MTGRPHLTPRPPLLSPDGRGAGEGWACSILVVAHRNPGPSPHLPSPRSSPLTGEERGSGDGRAPLWLPGTTIPAPLPASPRWGCALPITRILHCPRAGAGRRRDDGRAPQPDTGSARLRRAWCLYRCWREEPVVRRSSRAITC